MKHQVKDPNKDPLNLLKETIFYSPKVENLRSDTLVTKTKSEKFFRGGTNQDTPTNNMPNILNTKASFATTTITNFNTEPDRPVTEASNYRNPHRFLRIQPNVTTSEEKVIFTARESHYDIFEQRTSKQDLIDDMLSTQNKSEIRKIYTAASEFRALAYQGTEYSDRAIGKSKFVMDKKNSLVSQVKKINRDITHVLDSKNSREDITPFHDTGNSLPDVKSHHIQKFRTFIESIQRNDNIYPRGLNFSQTERRVGTAHDTDIRHTNFLAGSTSPDRTNRLNSEEFRSTFTSLGKIASGEVSSERLKSNPKITVLEHHYPYQAFGKFDTSENSYYSTLKKILPSAFTNSSVGRPEVVLMGTWVMSTIDALNKDTKMDIKERLIRADEIYNICLSELIRQVSCECVERAELLTQVWKAYVTLTEDVLKENKDRENEAIAKAKDEAIKVQSLYLKIVSEKDQELIEAEEKFRQLQTKMQKLTIEKDEVNQRNINLEKENKKLNNLNDRYKRNYGLVVKESKDWEFKYNKIKKDYGAAEVEIEEEPLPISKAKTKTYEELSSSSSEDEQDLKRKPTQTFGTANFKIIKTEDKGTDYDWEKPLVPTADKEVQSRLFLIDHKYDTILKDNITINNIIMEEMIKEQLLKQGELIETMLANEALGEEELKTIEGWAIVDKLRHKKEEATSLTTLDELKSEPGITINIPQTDSSSSIDEKPVTPLQKTENILNKLKRAIKAASPKNSLTHLLPPGGVIEEEENERSMIVNSKAEIDDYTQTQSENTLSPMKTEESDSPSPSRAQSLTKAEVQIHVNPPSTRLSIPIINVESEDETESNLQSPDQQSPVADNVRPVIRVKPVFKRMNSLSSQTSIEEDFEGESKEEGGNTKGVQNLKKLLSKKKLGFSEKMRMNLISAPVTPKVGNVEHQLHVKPGDRTPSVRLSSGDKTLTSLSVIEKIRSLSKSSKLKSLTSQNSLDGDLKVSPGNTLEPPKQKGGTSALNLIKNLADKMTTKGLKSMTSLQNLDKNSLAIFEHEEQKIAHFITMYKVEKKKQEEMTEVARVLEGQMKKDQELIRMLQELLQEALRGGLSADEVGSLFRQIDDRTKEVEKLGATKLKLLTTLQSPQEEDAKEGHEVTIITPRYKEPTKEFVYQGSFSRNSMVILKKQMLLEKKNNPAPAIVKKIKSTFNTRLAKSKSVIPIKSILKQITNFYQERITMAKENPMIRDLDMTTFVYRYFINTFGYNKFSLEKFGKFVLSVKKHSQNPRVMKFAKMLGILEEGNNYSFEEAKQFITGLEFLSGNTLGANVQNADHDAKHFVPWARAAEYIKVFGEKHMRMEEINDLRRDIEKLKISDPSGRNLNGIIDVDLFLDRIVMRYQMLMSKHRESYKTAFKCADLLGDDKVGYMEFTAMFKMIEPDKFEEKKTEEILLNYCDIVQEEEIGLSFEKFFSACFDHNLFSEYKLNSYIGLVKETDLDKMFEELKEKWPSEMEALRQKIDSHSNSVPLHVSHLWKTALNSIDHNIQEDTKVAKKASLIGFKLISNDIYNSLGRN